MPPFGESAVYTAALATRPLLEQETLSLGWALDIKKSTSTGWRAANHCEPERLNSITSGKPAAATRKRFRPPARTMASTMTPTGYLISVYMSELPWRLLEYAGLRRILTILTLVMELTLLATRKREGKLALGADTLKVGVCAPRMIP